ncbi:unnamed protein product [Anisakis simplex]|uniref:G_PROTEIN_RECEP_F1_2 domain-containing protein n=1 Tax=Anisakis simplex TaxID=6269 RepID=A0A0M3JYG7_ANISI|nr:unnamed protein product [Anisakis simplex]
MSNEDEAFQRTDDGDLKAPTLIATDYLEIAVLAVVLCIGVPLNAVVLYKLLKQYSIGKTLNRVKQDDTRIGFLMLKIHLTIVDLIFIILYCPSKLVWLVCYVWPFGAFLCKAVQYSWMFAHHSMSFAIVSIAIDRAKTVHDLMAMRERGRVMAPNSKINCIKRMIVLTYLGAAALSLPQWLAWTTADLGSWSQCTTIWHQQRAKDFLSGHEYRYFFYWEQIYTIVHLTTMFWGPFVILFLSYACITLSLFLYSMKSTNESATAAELHRIDADDKLVKSISNNISLQPRAFELIISSKRLTSLYNHCSLDFTAINFDFSLICNFCWRIEF